MIVNDDPIDVGAALRAARDARGWSGGQLAEAAGVSRAMIDRIERGMSSPTADFLGKVSAALGLTMSALLTREAGRQPPLLRREQRAAWADPVSGYSRQQVVAAPTFPVDVTEVRLPPGARVTYPAASFAFTQHLIWVLGGILTFREGDTVNELAAGDRLVVGEAMDCQYANSSADECVYCVIVARV